MDNPLQELEKRFERTKAILMDDEAMPLAIDDCLLIAQHAIRLAGVFRRICLSKFVDNEYLGPKTKELCINSVDAEASELLSRLRELAK